MTDDQLREACARARGWREWGFPGEGNAKIWLDANDNPHRCPPPIDGNTAMALLEKVAQAGYTYPHKVSIKTHENGVSWKGADMDYLSGSKWATPLSARNVAIACLHCLGEISAEDISDG